MTQSAPLSRLPNLIIALAAIILSVAIFLGFQTQVNSTSLAAQAAQSIPLPVAMSNGKPTLTEFYADWCTSCQAMAPAMAQLKKTYGNSVNFVMLNVDNSKWLPEILNYRVDGIPHLIFFNPQGKAIAQSIGEQPQSIMKANLEALIADLSLPYANATGQTSDFNAPVSGNSGTEPRSHSVFSN
jgi:thiol-disulfide isomerase/thioredoxin